MAPPFKLVVLPEIVELVTVRVPEFLKAPPSPSTCVKRCSPRRSPEMERLPPEAMLKILKLRDELLGFVGSLPLMVSEEALGPVMVRVPTVVPVPPVPEAIALASKMVGSAAVKAMVPVTPVLKTISSLPGVVLARVIAASRDPGPEAAVFRTVIGAGTILPSSWRSWGGAGSSCFSILGVAKEFTERI